MPRFIHISEQYRRPEFHRYSDLNLEAHFSPGTGAVQQSRSELRAFAIMVPREMRHE